VLVSTNCGQSFQVIYNARNDTAFVAPDGANPNFAGAISLQHVNEWIKEIY
jgi:hypothetical protein